MTKRTKVASIFLLFIPFLSCQKADKNIEQKQAKDDIISVEYPEVYELANIVLALTEYGITDKWQVRKDMDYYDDMRKYFEPFMEHPLLDSVNFSKARWQEYLSYRTDSYVFELDEEYKLKRKNDFQSFGIKTFDKFIPLTEDFASKSKFKDFFNNHKDFYEQIIQSYQNEYLLAEMKDFLTEEFGDFFANKKYCVVISPFVYAQQLHRNIDSTWIADFPSVAKPIIERTGFKDKEDKSAEVHTLFTEMNHGYVNPTTNKHDIQSKFNEKIWDDESGYNGDAVFNEYMTWAVFDIFNSTHFPEFAEKVNINWHFQNDTRGFQYSNLFATKLKEKYDEYEGKKRIKDLYPEILAWTQEVQHNLSKPILLNDSDTLEISTPTNLVKLEFSEPMNEVKNFDVILQFSRWEKDVINISETNNLKWEEDGRSLSFEIELPQKEEYDLLLNWWGVEKPLFSKKGILLQGASGLVIKIP